MADLKSQIKESALLIGRETALVGVLTEPVCNEKSDLPNNAVGVLLLNAGLIHHIGPNRVYVKLARRLAENGFAVVRFDYSGIGDSSPRRDKLPVSESIIAETRSAMEQLQDSKGVKEFVLIGLCAGAATAYRMATIDRRVRKVIMINPLLPNTQQVGMMRQMSHYRYNALFKPSSWLKLFAMRINYRRALQVLGYLLKKQVRPSSVKHREPDEIVQALRKGFRCLHDQEVHTLLINSDEDVGGKYFKEMVREEFKAMQASGYLTTRILAGSDHTVTPLKCQDILLDMISNWLSQ